MRTLLHYGLPLAASLALGALLGSPGNFGSRPDPPLIATNTTTTTTPPAAAPPAAALAAISNSDLPTHYTSTAGKDRDLVARFWSRADPSAFLAHLTSQDPPFFSDPPHALHLFDTWATRDFDAAFQAALDLSPFNPLRLHIQHRAIAVKFATDPAAAIASLEHVWANNGSTNDQLIPYLDTPRDSLTHLAKLPRTDVAATAIVRSLGAWAKTDPAAALAWAQENDAPTDHIITAAWRNNPDLAVDLLSALTSPRARSQAATNLAVNHLRIGSPEISVALIDNYLDGWTRSDTARRLAEKIARKYPKQATERSLTFSSPAARSAALTASLSLFDRDAPRSLELWLSTLPDSPSTKLIQTTLEKIRRPAAPPADKPSLP